jgi:hypothetical protein
LSVNKKRLYQRIFYKNLLDSYSFNQNICYILIIPGFGIISTTISASSNKSVFGQDGPLSKNYLTQQTIRRKLVSYIKIIQTTFLCVLYIKINNIKINLENVRMFVQRMSKFYINNPPITKAPNLNLKSQTSMSNGLSMLVGISEAIRLFSTSSKKNSQDIKFNE